MFAIIEKFQRFNFHESFDEKMPTITIISTSERSKQVDKCLLYSRTAVLSLSLQRIPVPSGPILLKCIWLHT